MIITRQSLQIMPENDPTASQETARHIRAELAEVNERLSALETAPPRFAEAGKQELEDLGFVIKRLLATLDGWREYWDEVYLQEMAE